MWSQYKISCPFHGSVIFVALRSNKALTVLILDPSTKGWIVTAVGKLTSQIGQLYDSTRDVLEKHVTDVDVELRQVGNTKFTK